MSDIKNRRKMIKNLLAGTAAMAVPGSLLANINEKDKTPKGLRGNINHSVCRWCFNQLSVDELCIAVKNIGFNAIDLVGPKDFDILRKYGTYSSMCNGAEINLVHGWNNKQYHDTLVQNYTTHIEMVAAAGFKNLICFSGNRNGMDDESGLVFCVEGLKKIMALAEKKGIMIQMELLNSKINHVDYMCDKSAWGIELCKRLDSPNFKLLYDIYHMQIDEGNVISTIQNNHQYFGHYHTAGVPGRHEIDETQELYYPAIMKAILATGFKGYVAQEFMPIAEDKLASLKDAVLRCDV